MTAEFFINLFKTRHSDVVFSDHGAPMEDEDDALDDILLHEEPIGGRHALEYWCTLVRHHDGELEEISLRRAAYERRSIQGREHETTPLPDFLN